MGRRLALAAGDTAGFINEAQRDGDEHGRLWEKGRVQHGGLVYDLTRSVTPRPSLMRTHREHCGGELQISPSRSPTLKPAAINWLCLKLTHTSGGRGVANHIAMTRPLVAWDGQKQANMNNELCTIPGTTIRTHEQLPEAASPALLAASSFKVQLNVIREIR